MRKILVINGPNLNLLGLREPALYGAQNFEALQGAIREWAAALGLEVELFQSNHEGSIVDAIQAAYGCVDGAFWEENTGCSVIMLNGGAGEARTGRLGLLNRDILRWAFRKELPAW